MPASVSAPRLIALVASLGLDTLAVALALGAAGLGARMRTRLAATCALFETAMPLAGAALGAPLGAALGAGAQLAAAGVLIALGLYMLVGERGEESRLLALRGGRGLAGAALLGFSVSVDELAVGFGAGLLRLPIVPLATAVGAQAFILTQLGLWLGGRVNERLGELAERFAGAALLALGAVLATERLAA